MPRSASLSAIPRPMPRDAPVINAVCCVSVIGMTPSRSRYKSQRGLYVKRSGWRISIRPGLIDVGLHFRADVLGVGQIKFSGFQALVAKPTSIRPGRIEILQPDRLTYSPRWLL